VRIGIVTHSAATADVLRRAIALEPAHEILWTASSGADAVDRCALAPPDLVLLDATLAAVDGTDPTRRIMAARPCAILLVADGVKRSAGRIFEAMGHGALDAVDTPDLSSGDLRQISAPLLAKIAAMSPLVVSRQDAGRAAGRRSRIVRAPRGCLVAVGASAGGPAVLATMLKALPKHFPAPIVIVQHVDEQFAVGMAAWLGQSSALPVRVAQESDRPAPGEVLLASTSDHLTLKTADRLGYVAEPRDQIYRPSVDVFFQSVSRLWRGEVVGVLLTGMGRDGALGLKALRERGHYTIAQDEATSAVYGMPKAAVALNAAVDILAADRIAARLMEVLAC
jgi:chemotaxis response regulator CheB